MISLVEKSAEAIVVGNARTPHEGPNHLGRMAPWHTQRLMKQKHGNLPHGGSGKFRGGQEKCGKTLPHEKDEPFVVPDKESREEELNG